MAAANSLSVSAPFRCSAANASSPDEIPARSIRSCGADAATTTPSTASPGAGAPSPSRLWRRGYDFRRRERETQDICYRGVDVGRRLRAKESAHDEVRLRPSRRRGD